MKSDKQKKEKKENKKIIEKKIIVFLSILCLISILAFLSTLFLNIKNSNEPHPVIVFETTIGNIELTLDREKAPVTTNNFLDYVKKKHYDGLIMHRVVLEKFVEGGVYSQNYVERKTSDPIILESNNGLKNLKGTIASSRGVNPDSATSGFFINLNDNPSFDYNASNPGYAVFGRVTKGIEFLEAIRKEDLTIRFNAEGWPKQNIVIIKAYRKK